MQRIRSSVTAIFVACGFACTLAGAGSASAHPYQQDLKRWQPVPILMPIVRRHASELRLTQRQDHQIAHWVRVHRRSLRVWRRRVLHNNAALRKAVLHNESPTALRPLVASVEQDQLKLLHRKISYVRFLHRILTPAQWKETLRLYRRR